MMKNVPSIVTESPRDKSIPNSMKLPTGLPYLYVKSPHSTSPTTRSHFKDLPDDVVAVRSDDPAAIRSFLEGDSLIFDIRPFNNYSASRLKNAYNVCIPTTLLKRPNYDLTHVANSSALPSDVKDQLTTSTQPIRVLVYDASSGVGHVTFGLYQTIQKFIRSDRFTLGFLDGGFHDLHESLRDDSALSPDQTPVSPETPLHPVLNAGRPDSAKDGCFASSPGESSRESSPFLSGFTLPAASAANHKMLMSIKKTLPRIDTTTTYSYKLRFPEGFAEKKDRLPQWLSFFADGYGEEGHNEKVVGILSDKFNKLEKSEQVRLSIAISNTNNEKSDQSDRASLSSGKSLHSGLSSGYCSPSAPCPDCDKIHYTIPKGVEYGYKNRYNNIWPYEHSRVKLVSSPSCTNPKKDTTDDYFNANYIKCKQLSLTEYIATQSPLESTKEDFWNTVWYNGIKGIVCLNKPSVFAPQAYYESDQHFDKSKLSVTIKSTEDLDGFTVRKMELEKHGKIRLVYHIAYADWPDFGVPDNFDTVSRLIDCKNKVLDILKEQKPPTSTNSLDLLVHCSAGCGRTGCFITLDMVNDCFKGKSNGKYDPWGAKDLVYKAVQLQRQQRIAMVQTLDQFIYCYESILHALFKSYM